MTPETANPRKEKGATMTNEKDRLKGFLQDYVESVTKEDRRGGQNKYVCPICGSGTKAGANHNGAFTVFPNNKWKCFSCGAGGDVFDLIGRIENIPTFKAQLERAEELFGDATPKNPKSKENKNMTDFKDYIEECKKNINETDYLERRGLKKEIITEFNIGYNKERETIVIPYNKQGTYFIERSVSGKLFRKPKAETAGAEPIFNEEALDDVLPCFVTESPIDALSIMQEGLFNAVAIGGTGTSKLRQRIEARRPNCGLILSFDNDEAGRKATDNARKVLDEFGITFIEAEWSNDPNLGYNAKYPEPRKDANDLLRGNEGQFAIDIEKNCERLEAALQIKESESTDILSMADEMKTFCESVKGLAKTPTGLNAFDEVLNGGLSEGLYILGAEPSFGKTTLALQIADNIAERGTPVMFFTMEMSKRAIIAKNISRKTYEIRGRLGYDLKCAKTTDEIVGALSRQDKLDELREDELETLKAAMNEMTDPQTKMFLIEERLTVEQIKEKVREFIGLKGETPMIFIDYLQYVKPSSDGLSDKATVDYTLSELKSMSKTYGLTIFALSTLNRAAYNAPLTISAFKESGGIEFAADVLMGLQYTDVESENFNKDMVEKGYSRNIDLKVLKNRNGAKSETVKLSYIPKFNIFR